MVSFEGAVSSSREPGETDVPALVAEVEQLRNRLEVTERELREARIELAQRS